MKKLRYNQKGDKMNPKELETPDEEGYTALLAAIERTSVNVVSLLIEAGANCNTEEKQGGRALDLEGDESIASLLIKGGADCNAADKQGRRAFDDASTQGNKIMVALLLENGAIVNPREKGRKTPLQLAFKADQRYELDERAEIMRSFLKENNQNTTEPRIDEVKEDVLVLAAKGFNRRDITVLLMKKGPGLVEQSSSNQWGAIEWATYRTLPKFSGCFLRTPLKRMFCIR